MKVLKTTHLNIVILKSSKKSYSWNDGLFAVYKIENDIYHLWKIKDGKLHCYDTGTRNITCTSVNNPDVIKTDMSIVTYEERN